MTYERQREVVVRARLELVAKIYIAMVTVAAAPLTFGTRTSSGDDVPFSWAGFAISATFLAYVIVRICTAKFTVTSDTVEYSAPFVRHRIARARVAHVGSAINAINLEDHDGNQLLWFGIAAGGFGPTGATELATALGVTYGPSTRPRKRT